MGDLVEKMLDFISKVDEVNTLDLAFEYNVDHQKIVGALKSIQARGDNIVNAELVLKK